MLKFVKIFVLIVLAAFIQATPIVKRDVSHLLRHHEPGHVVYGNGIVGADAKIEHEHFQIDPIGNYNFAYKQTDLQEREEKGEVAIDPKTGNYTLDNVVGSYKYVRPDGLWQIVEYRADGNGFAPKIHTEKYEGPQ